MRVTGASNMALFALVLFSLVVSSALSARIAGYCSIGVSEYLNTRQILEELAARGHEVARITVISRLKLNESIAVMRHKNIGEIIFPEALHTNDLTKKIPVCISIRKLEYPLYDLFFNSSFHINLR